jgi:hypothetical protein
MWELKVPASPLGRLLFKEMIEWLQSKLSERFHSIMKKPQTTACGRINRMS